MNLASILLALAATQADEVPYPNDLARIAHVQEVESDGSVDWIQLQAALNALRATAEKGGKAHLVALDAIIQSHKGLNSGAILIEAVNAYLRLGGGRDYLLRVMAEAEPAGVFAVIWILGREANAEFVSSVEREFERRPHVKTSKTLAALSEARVCCASKDRLDRLSALQDRVAFLADMSLGTYSRCDSKESDPVLQLWYSSEYDLAPTSTWARNEMLLQGENSPSEVAMVLQTHSFPSIARLLENASPLQVEATREMLRCDIVAHMGPKFIEMWSRLGNK